MTIHPTQLYRLVDQHFNEEELRTLCFDLDESYDNLGGRGKAANVRELVELLQCQQRLPDLIALARVGDFCPKPRKGSVQANRQR